MSAHAAANLMHRATVTGLVGLSVWGLWLTAAVWKSRRDDRAVSGLHTSCALRGSRIADVLAGLLLR